MKKIIKYMSLIMFISIIIILLVNIYVIFLTKSKIKDIDKIDELDIDCIIVLGAGIRGNNPSPMLEDRLLTSIELYNKNISSKDIFMDHAGFSTYESIYRAKEIFNAKKVVIVTQKYHLYRALYIAKELDLEAYGVSANRRTYNNQIKRDIREVAARIKDLIKCIFKPESTYLGETIPIDSDGNITDDK